MTERLESLLAQARARLAADRERSLAEVQSLLGIPHLRVNRYDQIVVTRAEFELLKRRASEATPDDPIWVLTGIPIVLESPREQRQRILQENLLLSPTQYDLAISFGYEPESWEGMYRLADVDYPILRLSRSWAIAREVVLIPGTYRAARRKSGRERRRWVLRRSIL